MPLDHALNEPRPCFAFTQHKQTPGTFCIPCANLLFSLLEAGAEGDGTKLYYFLSNSVKSQ